MAHPVKASDLIVFGEAAAGHDGVLTDDTGAIIVKPCTSAEADFYESAQAAHPDFASFMPTFMGRTSLATSEEKEALKNPDPMSISAALQAQEGTAEELLRDNTEQKPSASNESAKGHKVKTDLAIVLDNIAGGFVRPNVMDVKLGARLFADDAPESKRVRLSEMSEKTTSGSLGMRITGMRVWEPASPEAAAKIDGTPKEPAGQYKIYEKKYGRDFTADNVEEGFRTFFCNRGANGKLALSEERRWVLELCEQEVGRMMDMLQSEESRAYSASILFVFEGDATALSEALDNMEREQAEAKNASTVDGEREDAAGDEDEDDEDSPREHKVAAVKLIDFAHAQWTPGQGPDTNMLQGMASTRSILQRILNSGHA